MVCQSEQHSAAVAYDPAVMLERIGGDMSLFTELVEMFHEDYPPLLEEIRLAIADRNASRLKFAAHTLRGAIGNFTTGSPYDHAKQLESMAQDNNLSDAQSVFCSLAAGVDQLATALTRCMPCSV